MKNFLAGWIVWQLVILGMVFGTVSWEVDNSTYQCVSSNSMPEFVESLAGAAVPLIIFVPTHSFISNYCDRQASSTPSVAGL